MSWWYLQNLKHERELKELKKAREIEQQDYINNKRYQDLMKKYSNFSLDDEMLEVWRDLIQYIEIEENNGNYKLIYEWMADEPNEDGLDVYIVEETSFPFNIEDLEDAEDFYGLNVEKAFELYWELGPNIPFSFEDFSIFIRKELSEYSDTILW